MSNSNNNEFGFGGDVDGGAGEWNLRKISRAIFRGPLDVQPDAIEEEVFGQNKLPIKYQAYRRWGLVFAFPFAVGALVFQVLTLLEAIDDQDDKKNGSEVDKVKWRMDYYKYNEVIEICLTILSAYQLFAIAMAIVKSKTWATSRNWLVSSWLVSFIFTFCQFLVPVKQLLNFDDLYVGVTSDPNVLEVLAVLELPFISYIVSFDSIVGLAPAAISLLPAAVRGATLTKNLYPESAEMGWVIRLLPFFIAPVLAAFMLLIVQITGSWLLVPATVLIVAAFLAPSAVAGRICLPCTVPDVAAWAKKSLILKLVFGVPALVLIGIYLGVDQIDDIELNPIKIVEFILSFIVKFKVMEFISGDYTILFYYALCDAQKKPGPGALPN